jgi:hypothetical protein
VVPQRAISSSVRAQPMHQPVIESIRQTLVHGDAIGAARLPAEPVRRRS